MKILFIVTFVAIFILAFTLLNRHHLAKSNAYFVSYWCNGCVGNVRVVSDAAFENLDAIRKTETYISEKYLDNRGVVIIFWKEIK